MLTAGSRRSSGRAWADLGNLHQGGRAGSGDEQGGQVDTSAVGASRGAEGAEGGRAWDWVPPSPMGRGLGRGPYPLPRKFLNF